MARNRKQNMTDTDASDMDRTDVQREDRTMGAGAHGDKTAGNEGIDSPRSPKKNDRQQGRESNDGNAADFSGQGNQREGADRPEGTGYTSK